MPVIKTYKVIILVHTHFVYFFIQLRCLICIQHYFQQMMNLVQEDWNSNWCTPQFLWRFSYVIIHYCGTWINILQKCMHDEKYDKCFQISCFIKYNKFD